VRGQPLSQFWDELSRALGAIGIEADAPRPDYPDAPPAYDIPLIENWWTALARIDLLLKQFRAELREETSAVQFWSHHFDLAMMWFSGRLVPGKDPADAEHADEQMNFGFSPGDGGIPEPYFYVTAYPTPDGFVNSPLPPGAAWHSDGWKGAVLRYKTLVESTDPDARLLNFFRSLQKRGGTLMS
jgi:hypothetical protein